MTNGMYRSVFADTASNAALSKETFLHSSIVKGLFNRERLALTEDCFDSTFPEERDITSHEAGKLWTLWRKLYAL